MLLLSHYSDSMQHIPPEPIHAHHGMSPILQHLVLSHKRIKQLDIDEIFRVHQLLENFSQRFQVQGVNSQQCVWEKLVFHCCYDSFRIEISEDGKCLEAGVRREEGLNVGVMNFSGLLSECWVNYFVRLSCWETILECCFTSSDTTVTFPAPLNTREQGNNPFVFSKTNIDDDVSIK